MRDYRELKVWEIARKNNKMVYELTEKFPKKEMFSLVDQMRRASVSIISNISEGCGCDSDKEFVRYLRISMGSIKELESQFYVALDVGYISEKDFEAVMVRLDDLGRKLWKYIWYLKNKEVGVK